MESLEQQLHRALQENINAYNDLLETAVEKKDVIIKNNVERLMSIMTLEEERVAKLSGLNDMLMGALLRFKEKNGLSDIPTLSEAIAIASTTEQGQLKALQKQLQDTVFDLGLKNDVNQKLVETHLQYTAFCLEALTQIDSTGDLYSSKGYVNEEATERIGLIDHKA